uniref:Uncharacterized protein n=1 Tax=Arundo donax TaxID=35708 RepID=A0A0A9BK05_ARUDO
MNCAKSCYFPRAWKSFACLFVEQEKNIQVTT